MPPYTILTLLLIIPATISKSAKTNARPVHEIINEQSRIDEKKLTTPGFLPYGNPLAGNSQQNARLHAQNQQAMFNAERIRQHRAQVQRWTQAPIKMDSYMKAYHESQESHQLALEQQQAKLRDAKTVATTPRSRPTELKSRRQEKRVEPKRVERIRLHSPDPTKITKADAIIKDRSRNHRSYGASDHQYHQYLHPKRYQTVYLSPGPTYDQGVTIKPNGNVGLKHYQATHETKLYTEAIPSTERPIYPKQYHQMQEYQSAQDIDALKSLLKTNSKDQQLSGLNALIVSGEQNKEEEEKHKNLETPIDLYFYLKDAPSPNVAQQYDHTKYAQIPQYASAYMPEPVVKDHTPITEQVDDIEDPNKHRPNYVRTLVQPVVTPAPAAQQDTTTTKSNNYYKVEVASQTISSGLKYREPDYYVNEDLAKPSHQALQYAQPQYPPSQYGTTQYGTTQYGTPQYETQSDESDQSERYLHHNAQPTGVQHLTEDGTGVSAYGDDSLHYAANYEFGYRVRDHHSGNDFGHQEAKHGDNTNGAYHVLLPDGRMQKVRYSAGPEGFHADISYDHLQYKH
ncbi:uncharacterized protein LOC125237109 [Leguminivora glycinivorella]|uniref:uncharacterized protein LOC125237109 n=1 Tax=Leguminivora glycinivorella TaxID=1035111 RepID=UPI00200E48EA|nr:uncharacterized protein LOC125237109 [Leguminivora glycinivorella]XP_048000030.1 uncharacterized protein LOC125237109 [Leguminivora glycinivorella]